MWLLTALALTVPFASGASSLAAAKIIPEPVTNRVRTVRVLVPNVSGQARAIHDRLRKLTFEVALQAPDKFRITKGIDVIFLPTDWGDGHHSGAPIDSHAERIHVFVERGGGLIVGQPNSHAKDFTPKLLPYPISFDWRYDKTDPTRLNLGHDHFITEDLPDNEMPFPADAMTKIDRRYRVLAKQKSTGALSLAVAEFGAGRVVVQTGCESLDSYFPLSDEILCRMVLWAAKREPRSP